MTDNLPLSATSPPALPEPGRERWQPLRLGLVELFHYDSEEFRFHDGHLLLRGNNGTGKSKVLSLTLPLLFDAHLRPSRIEPDGDPGKKMAWNLLMGGHYERRIGYSWIEFGRRDDNGRARYLTLGVGLSAAAARQQVESWFFLLEGDGQTPDPRLGQDLWLTTADRHVLTRDRLREAIAGRGMMFENNAQGYRRAVDERLFHLGTQRYGALMDTLIQLRQPQLSKKPDESGLSHALGESLPPLPTDLLGDVAEALNQLEEDRSQLEDTRRLEQTVSRFEQRYRNYAGMLARRQARELRRAQTGFDKASEARSRGQAECEAARVASSQAGAAVEEAGQAYFAAREHLETLQSDPANQDANRLAQAEADANDRREEADAATMRCDTAQAVLQRESERSRERAESATQARGALEATRGRAFDAATAVGLDAEYADHPLFASPIDAIAVAPSDPQATGDGLREATQRRRRDIAHLRQRHGEVDQHQVTFAARQEAQQDARIETTEALQRREQADQDAEAAGTALVQAWAGHSARLRQLRFDADEPLQKLADWAARPDGENPARAALDQAWQTALKSYAAQESELDTLRETQRLQRADLDLERERLLAGETAGPTAPATRAAGVREDRPGAPLWQLVDFQSHLDAAERAGLEAALEASGLLDAWLSPQGDLTDGDGDTLLDTGWQRRPAVSGASLSDALLPTPPEGCDVPAQVIAELLAGIAYGPRDRHEAESWLSPEGRFRLGALAGAWRKPEAGYVGHAARERARRQRLEDIDDEIARLNEADEELVRQVETLGGQRDEAEEERRAAPSDQPLRDAIATATSASQDVDRARARLEQAAQRSRDAEARLHEAREKLQRDAADLRLPHEVERLPHIERALDVCEQVQALLVQAAREWQRAWPAHSEQQQREAEARQAAKQAEQARDESRIRATRAHTRLETLRQNVGRQVDELRSRLAAARSERDRIEGELEEFRTTAGNAAKAHAVAESELKQKQALLAERIDVRAGAAERLHRFSTTGLLASALPELKLPGQWSIDPALHLSRRIEQALAKVNDDDTALDRVRKQISEDLGELQRGLGVLGHQAASEPNEFGLSVAIQYQNRSERPDTLARLLAQDVAQRSELLSAREREVLENHLQAEIAAEIQRLMRAANERVNAINAELHKRPTTTGVRFKLNWEPRSVEEGAPVGLDLARKRLLNTSADMWSPEDRRTVGEMLQQRIADERARADADVAGGSLVDQLARALDYRHWHRFRIQRLQDGQWRKLSGPASSGERALGLTVPLFAAIASFYEHGGSRLAPRLMLLDEAFAGIDDAARAHCMGLIREFDLDFVLTSEREWGCYAELPGVAICQLQRREGVDAVFVSRWAWDGLAKRVEDDPDRRFPPA